MIRAAAALASLVGVLVLVPAASAGGWLPHGKDASWTYSWSDSAYNATPTKEKVSVQSTKGDSFVLAWSSDGLGNSTDAPSTAGTVSFQDTSSGLVNTNWTSNPPPTNFPILCAQVSQCGNSLASVWFNVIWGSRQPTFAEPLLAGASWTSTGGAKNDVASSSDFLGMKQVTVPAFPHPVLAAQIRSEVSQAGAIGDPYGSGVRDVWWVYGVGPVKVVFRHSGGSHAPVTTAELTATNLAPETPPSDVDYFPLTVGTKGEFRWTNAHLKSPEVQSFTVVQSANGSARLSVSSVSGPIKTKGAYFYTRRTDGISSLAATTKAASLVTLPPLGPSSLPAAKRRHFYTVFDLLDFGFNPILPANPAAGTTWASQRTSRDFDVFGVVGSSKVLGVQSVHVPAGTFAAVAVRSTLTQAGYAWGSGVRMAWFAPGKGLVKLVFQHRDGTVSEVVRLS